MVDRIIGNDLEQTIWVRSYHYHIWRDNNKIVYIQWYRKRESNVDAKCHHF